MKHKKLIALSLLPFALCCCSGNNSNSNNGNDNYDYSVTEIAPTSYNHSFADDAYGDMDSYLNEDVNAIVQALPQIIVIPSDRVLYNNYCLKEKTIDGKTYKIRNYQDYFMNDTKAKPVISFIQEKFIGNGYPLNDLEQSLKAIDTQEAIDMASGIETDAKTTLLTTLHPDIILELDYKTGRSKQDISKSDVSFIITAIDPYTQKSIANISTNNAEGDNATVTLQDEIGSALPKLMNDIQGYFADILTRGRNVNITINVAEGSNQNLQSESIEGDTYADQIIDFIKTNTVKGAYTMQINTKNKLTFTNARIQLLNDDGTQYGVYDFTRDLQRYLKRNLGLSSTNNSQGLGNIVLTIEGI